jgi:hypothetical protein
MKLTPLWLALCSLPALACGPDGCETPLTLQLTAAQCHLNGLPFLSRQRHPHQPGAAAGR